MKTTMKTTILLVFLLQFSTLSFYGQEWVRVFYWGNGLIPMQLNEHYDKGYLIGADYLINSFLFTGWIIKTDVNGNTLWHKTIGNNQTKWTLEGFDNTPDGGLIISGSTDTLDPDWELPYVTKLNACGEVEWCHIYETANKPGYSRSIVTLADGTFILNLTESIGQRVQLKHLDQNGDIIWEQTYFQEDTLIQVPVQRSIQITWDQKCLITGYCYYPDSGQTIPLWLRPMLVLADSSGEGIWEIPWGYNQPFSYNVHGEGYQSLYTPTGIYTSISQYYWPNAHYTPTLIKTSLAGDPLSYHDIIDSAAFGHASTLDRISDSLFISGIWYAFGPTNPNLSVVKIDTIGDIKKEKIINHSEYPPKDALITSDNHYLITAIDYYINKLSIKLWKLDLDLEWAAIDTVPRTYDSLCPYPITSGPVFLQCDVISGIREPALGTEKVKMKVYPNPGRSSITVQMPECIQLQTSTEHLNVTTVFHQWNKDLVLEVFDTWGKKVKEMMITPSKKEINLDVSGWPPGVYLLRLLHKQQAVSTAKLMVE